MFVFLHCLTATLSPASKPQDPRLILRRLLLLLNLAIGHNGCHARPLAPAATPITPARSLTGPSSAVAQVQSSPLYQQARQDCKLPAYDRAAQALSGISTPTLC